jgi:hypothetical protein
MLRLMALILFRLTALTIAFAILITVARVIGREQPPPLTLAQLHLDDCKLPCWLGITPGETTFDDAVKRVTSAYPQNVSVQETQIFVAYLIRSWYGAASVQVAAGTVNSIFLLTSDVDGLAIGDVAALFGAPDCIPGESPAILIYNFPQGYAVLVASNGRGERWRQPLNNIEIHSYDQVRPNIRCPAAQQ